MTSNDKFRQLISESYLRCSHCVFLLKVPRKSGFSCFWSVFLNSFNHYSTRKYKVKCKHAWPKYFRLITIVQEKLVSLKELMLNHFYFCTNFKSWLKTNMIFLFKFYTYLYKIRRCREIWIKNVWIQNFIWTWN